METVAILVDGGFYQKKAQQFWGSKPPAERADELYKYCINHLGDKIAGQASTNRLYRIFYYDCPPSEKRVYHPLLKKDIDLRTMKLYDWMTGFHEQMRHKRKVALRLGELSDVGIYYNLTPAATKSLAHGTKQVTDLCERDFILNIEQKGVDMRIGLDIASMAHKKQVTRMVLISGDSDFVPAAKHARREGVDFVLDPMWNNIKSNLMEHIDGLKTFAPRPT